jgi:hypothetical protein
MSKIKQKRPTTRQLKNEIAIIVKELYQLKNYVNEVVTPFVTSNMSLFEKYIDFKGDIEIFLKYIEEEYDNEKRAVNKGTKEGKKKQAKGSRVTKTISKDGKGSRPRSIQ